MCGVTKLKALLCENSNTFHVVIVIQKLLMICISVLKLYFTYSQILYVEFINLYHASISYK